MDNFSGPSLSYYLVSFTYQGHHYCWRDDIKAFHSYISQRTFKKPPAGATWNENDFVSEWQMNKEDDEYDI